MLGAGDGGKDGYACRFVRGGLPKGRLVAHRIRDTRRTCAQGNHRLPGTWRNGEAVVVRFVRRAQEGPAYRPQSQDRQGSADLAAPGHGVQAVRHPQAADQFRARWR